jgi:hypothetical protein
LAGDAGGRRNCGGGELGHAADEGGTRLMRRVARRRVR